MAKTIKDLRAELLHIAAGGDGNIGTWIERVTLDDAPADKRTAYMYHDTTANSVQTYLGTLAECKNFYRLPYIELPAEQQPGDDDIQITDTGRHIPADTWRQLYGNMVNQQTSKPVYHKTSKP